MMRKTFLIGSLGVLVLITLGIGLHNARPASASTPLPLVTLVPPTPVPPPPTDTPTPPPVQSALAGIKANNRLTVGILYNAGRFATLTNTGDVTGFEASVAQAIADDWGLPLQFRQVTRQNAFQTLLSGQVDLLMGEVLLSRDMQTQVDYSDPLFIGKQVALVNNDAPMKTVGDLAGQTVGVVATSRSEQALNEWMKTNNIQLTVKRYLMLDGVESALRGLSNKEVMAVIGDRWELDQKVNGIPGLRLLDGALRAEPYAIALRRYDDNLRTLVNRTLQRLEQSKRLDQIYDAWFPKDLMPVEERVSPRVWTGLDTDTRALADFPTDVVMPTQPVIARITSGQPLRVAGLGTPPDSTGKTPFLEQFNQALINEMARRWGVPAQPVADSFGKGEDMLASGQADFALGVEPHWASVDRVDFVGVYAEHSYRMMIPYGSGAIKIFNDLFATRRQIGYFADDPGAIDVARKIAESTHSIAPDSLRPIKLQSDQDALQVLVTDHTADIIFGDSLRLIPVVQAYPKFVQLTDGQYGGGRAISFAVPRNDADFRVLVEATLQDMYRDGTYQKIYQANFGVGAPLSIVVWPGTSTLFGVKTSG